MRDSLKMGFSNAERVVTPVINLLPFGNCAALDLVS